MSDRLAIDLDQIVGSIASATSQSGPDAQALTMAKREPLADGPCAGLGQLLFQLANGGLQQARVTVPAVGFRLLRNPRR